MNRRLLPLFLLVLSLAACSNKAVPATSTPVTAGTETLAAPTATASMSHTPQSTASNTSLPSATPRRYDLFASRIAAHEVQVFYSPAVISSLEQLTAVIALPLQAPGSIEQPFSGLYEVTVEVYSRGSSEFEPGQPTGAQYTFKGKDIDGERRDGAMLLSWHAPVYNSGMPYVYRFTIFPLGEEEALGEVILSGLPDPAGQVSFMDWPTAEPDTELPPDATPTYDPFPDVVDSGRND